ncbi:hypothetical protein BDZ85DRAFT_39622 [Elsinoe ampelina]|uniref:Uncharacterized protein n=1 Tax=Elsinoe ampelina TaxID=302913 RepID=A0A6A6G2L0_9PEZI|nr:hypothetical protein BDZ85DRAFT_39622 [Elsinoe ampelina]
MRLCSPTHYRSSRFAIYRTCSTRVLVTLISSSALAFHHINSTACFDTQKSRSSIIKTFIAKSRRWTASSPPSMRTTSALIPRSASLVVGRGRA